MTWQPFMTCCIYMTLKLWDDFLITMMIEDIRLKINCGSSLAKYWDFVDAEDFDYEYDDYIRLKVKFEVNRGSSLAKYWDLVLLRPRPKLAPASWCLCLLPSPIAGSLVLVMLSVSDPWC